MRPTFTPNYQPYAGLRDAVLIRKCILRYATFRVSLPDSAHISFRKLGLVMSFASRRVQPVLGKCVKLVIGIRAEEKVRWIHTRTIVTGMANKQPIRNCTIMNDITCPVRANRSIWQAESSVSRMKFTGLPRPARVNAARTIYLRPETLNVLGCWDKLRMHIESPSMCQSQAVDAVLGHLYWLIHIVYHRLHTCAIHGYCFL